MWEGESVGGRECERQRKRGTHREHEGDGTHEAHDEEAVGGEPAVSARAVTLRERGGRGEHDQSRREVREAAVPTCARPLRLEHLHEHRVQVEP